MYISTYMSLQTYVLWVLYIKYFLVNGTPQFNKEYRTELNYLFERIFIFIYIYISCVQKRKTEHSIKGKRNRH